MKFLVLWLSFVNVWVGLSWGWVIYLSRGPVSYCNKIYLPLGKSVDKIIKGTNDDDASVFANVACAYACVTRENQA